jgi:catechol 2,3-dioxygenase-like lactoylglutathione lyase family enzyme
MSERRIDHLVIAIRDLEAAAKFYDRLDFQVGPRNRHPWGAENRLVQLRSWFLELITVDGNPAAIPPHEPGRFSFGAFVRDYLGRREGCAMLVLDSSDARADAAAFGWMGSGEFEPFFFERKGRRPDGSETHVAFTLAFAIDPDQPDAAFFVCEQHRPEEFWNADFQRDFNGATDIRAVTLSVANPPHHAGFLAGFSAVPGTSSEQGEMTFPLGQRGELLVGRQGGATGISAFAVVVPDPDLATEILAHAGVPFSKADASITIKAEDAFGVAIHLVPESVV